VTSTPLIKTILFATDFSSCAERAFQYALQMASAWQASLHVFHVLEFQPGMDPEFPVSRLYLDELRKTAGEQLDALVRRARSHGAPVSQQQAVGIPSQEIRETARKLAVDLIVLGTHGRTGLAHILLGSTAERTVTSAPCPVMVVREDDGVAKGFERILAPIDFSDCSLDALEYAARMARQFKAKLTILHVMEPEAYGLDFTLRHAPDPARIERLRNRLADLTASLTRSGIEAEHGLRGGLPVDTILNAERSQPADLIVMGTHGRRGLSHLISGSVTHAVLRQARCPVLTVRSPKFTRAGTGTGGD
jgi:nucleotide-binding universal stress UspA family protein